VGSLRAKWLNMREQDSTWSEGLVLWVQEKPLLVEQCGGGSGNGGSGGKTLPPSPAGGRVNLQVLPPTPKAVPPPRHHTYKAGYAATPLYKPTSRNASQQHRPTPATDLNNHASDRPKSPSESDSHSPRRWGEAPAVKHSWIPERGRFVAPPKVGADREEEGVARESRKPQPVSFTYFNHPPTDTPRSGEPILYAPAERFAVPEMNVKAALEQDDSPQEEAAAWEGEEWGESLEGVMVGEMLIVVCEYKAEHADELDLKEGDEVLVVSCATETGGRDWIIGRCNGKEGLVPLTHVGCLDIHSFTGVE